MRSRSARQSGAERRLLALTKTQTIETGVAVLADRLVPYGAALPVHPEHFFARYRILAAVPDHSLPFAGTLEDIDGGFRIRYAANMSASRRRFTIAHELCHAIFATTGPRWPRTGKRLEQICEMFAATLLMPEWAVRHEWTACGPSVEGFRACAANLHVSITALAMRLDQLELAVVFEERDGYWKPVVRAARAQPVPTLTSGDLSDGRLLALPGVFPAARAARVTMGPAWTTRHYALLVPTIEQRTQPAVDSASLEQNLALVRAAADRGVERRIERPAVHTAVDKSE